jgi:antitoxin YefM
MAVLPVAEARARLSEIVGEAERTHERFEITRSGRPAAVLLAADDYEAMQETIAVLSDNELLTAHAVGLSEIAAGDYLDADQMRDRMRRASRPR